MIDLIEEIWSTVSRNKLRTALTGFAVSWGIFMLIVLLGAGNGVIHGMEQNSGRFLDHSMTVWPGSTSKPYNGYLKDRPINLRQQDLQISDKQFTDNIDEVTATLNEGPVDVVYKGNNISVQLNGVFPAKERIANIKMRCGRFINETDSRQKRKVIVLLDDKLKELNVQPENILGQTLDAGGVAYKVVGVMKSEQTGWQQDAYIPFTTLQTIYGKGDQLQNIEYTFHGLETEADNKAFERRYKSTINRSHYAAPDDDNTIFIFNRLTQTMQMNKGINILRTALWIVGLLTLLSGVVGVSNIMLISVKERTREFGIRKAIGATPGSLLRLVITESVIITTFFGYIGMVLGIMANNYMDATLGHDKIDIGVAQFSVFVNPTVDFSICVQATLVMILAGTLAGLIPARKASKVLPIEALRAE
jgi:putative ABC transport system permease protein